MLLPNRQTPLILNRMALISLLNNFEYDESGVRVWRAFNVGSGKEVPWAKFEGVMKQPEKNWKS